MLMDQGVPWNPENGETIENFQTAVFDFPIKSPDNAICNEDVDAIESLEYWKMIKTHWCEHNPSCFTGDEKFITDNGLKRFDEFKDNKKVNVLNKNGNFVPATVENFGKQRIYQIKLQSGNKTKTINTTKDHMWPIDNKMFKTVDLPLGKRLESVYPTKEFTSKEWKVVDIIKTDRYDTVYCVNEPKDHHFVLEGNILTHNCTIFVKDDEWLKVGNWVFENWNKIGGITFLPAEDNAYQLAPYEKIDAITYEKLNKNFPVIDFSQLTKYEIIDHTEGAREYACVGNSCELK